MCGGISMDKAKYFTLLAAAGVLCGQTAQAAVNPPRFNVSLRDAYYQAAKDEKPELIQKYIYLGYPIDISDSYGMTALCRAVSEGNDKAYDLLYRFGANPNAECVKQAKSLRSSQNLRTAMKYGGMALLAGGVVGAFAFASGGGGSGGSSSSDSSGDSSGDSSMDYTPGSNGQLDKSRDWSKVLEPVQNTSGNVAEFYDEQYFNNSSEYTNNNFTNEEMTLVNYLGAINAAAAYKHFYGTGSDGKFASNLENVKVGVIDSGVWGNHSEFGQSGGTKVTGYNFDYGPCLNGDTSHCWTVKEGATPYCAGGKCYLNVILLGENNQAATEESLISCDNGATVEACYNKWAAAYPAGYDWDSLQYYYYPNLINTGLDNISNALHGTNVASIIGGNMNGDGSMGVAGVNTTINAVRWDFMSSLREPLLKMTEDNVSVVNMSLGTTSDASSNASLINEYADVIDAGELNAYSDIIASYTDKTNPYTNVTGKDGLIIVKAAGNSSYEQPDLRSGIKLTEKYKDLQMLVVVAADVTMNGSSLESYKLSGFSNQCGVASGYCITAPGGSKDGKLPSYIVGAGQPDDEDNYYSAMMGTSQASPVVAGSLAFLKGAYPYMSSQEVIELVLNTANKTAAADGYTEKKYGAGLLDLGAAVNTYIADTSGLSTVVGNSLSGGRLNMSQSHLALPSAVKNSVLNALPKNLTVFDVYARPFAMPTANYISATHGGYKTLRNDVYQIAKPAKLSQVQNGNMNFAFAGSAANGNGSGIGFMQADYNGGSYNSGFYFSENTRYENGGSFAETTVNPFMAMQNAYGIYNTFNFNRNLGLKVEAVTGRNGLYDGDSSLQDRTFKKQAYAFNSELQLYGGKYFGLGLTGGLLYEEAATLGMNGSGAFKAQDSGTYNAGIKASWYVNQQLTLTGSYYRGYTQGQSFASNLLKTSDLVSESFAFDANYKVSRQTNMGFNVSSPLRVVDGTLSVNFPNGRDNYSDTVYFNRYQAALKSEAREYKFAMYVSHSFSDKLSLRSEFDVRVNPEHQRQANDYRALLGLNWNFN